MLLDGAEGGNSSPSLTNIVFYHNSVDENGGGASIWAYAGISNPKFMTVTFRANAAGSIKTTGVGGGLNNNEGNPVLINVLFEGNIAEYGGGMSTGGGSPILTDVTFISNTATIDGGGLANDAYGYPRLFDAQFIRNYALRHGGGMFNYFYGSAVMERVVFLENSTDGLGGGLSNFTGSNTIITDGVFIDNSAGFGGGIMNFDNDMTLVNGDFRGNKAEWGGGMYNDMSVLTMTNVVVSGNYSEKEGGGIVNDGSSVEMNNVTLSGNVSELSGGGMYSRFENDISVNNSIFSGNKDSSGVGTITATSTISENSIVTLTNSLVQGSGGSADWQAGPHVDGGGNIASDPLFVEPINLTAVPTSTGNLRLRFGSPAIDAGRNDLVPDGITEDLDGNSRIVYGLVDMGAYEWFQYRSYLSIVLQE